MTYTGGVGLDPSEIIGLLNVTETGEDVLRLHEIATRLDKGPYDINDAGGYGAHLDAVLSGRDDRCREAIAGVIRRTSHSVVDLTSARLMLHAGIDPATACALALMVDGPVTITRTWAPQVIVKAPEEACDPDCVVAMSLAHDISWNSDIGIRIGDLPIALAAAAHGRRLKDYVSHPVLDDHPLVLGGTDERFGRTWIRVTGMEPIDAETLLGMRPTFA